MLACKPICAHELKCCEELCSMSCAQLAVLRAGVRPTQHSPTVLIAGLRMEHGHQNIIMTRSINQAEPPQNIFMDQNIHKVKPPPNVITDQTTIKHNHPKTSSWTKASIKHNRPKTSSWMSNNAASHCNVKHLSLSSNTCP
eukprot:jgi/Botrbrau1/3474/Bobra.341_2s0006.1